MRKIENIFDNKMKTYISSMQNLTAISNETFPIATEAVKKVIADDVIASETIVLDDSSFELDDTVRTFNAPTCSTVIRPRVTVLPNDKKADNEAKKRKLTNCMLSRTTVDVFAVPLSPKRRIDQMASSCFNETTDNSFYNSSVIQCPPVRRSNRISTMAIARETTLRDAALAEAEANVTRTNERTIKRKPVKREIKPKVKNEVIASYFDNKFNATTKKVTKVSHKKAILDVINTASIKELQNLPTIGPKTAYQIVAYRHIHGEFKKFDDIKNVPMMGTGKKWDSFLIVS